MVESDPETTTEPSEPVPENMTTLELEYVEGVVDFILWDTPTSMIPTKERVIEIVDELRARPDVDNSIVQAALAECDRFLEIFTAVEETEGSKD